MKKIAVVIAVVAMVTVMAAVVKADHIAKETMFATAEQAHKICENRRDAEAIHQILTSEWMVASIHDWHTEDDLYKVIFWIARRMDCWQDDDGVIHFPADSELMACYMDSEPTGCYLAKVQTFATGEKGIIDLERLE